MRFFAALLLALFLAIPALAQRTPSANDPQFTSKGPIVLRASAVHTTDHTITFINDGGYCGAYVYYNATVDGASAIVTITLQIVEVGTNGVTDDIASFTETINAVEEKLFRIGTTTAATGVIDEIMQFVLPQRFNILLNHTDADAITYSASIHFVDDCIGALP